MLPLEILGRATADRRTELVLYHRDGVFQIRVNGLELMSSRGHGSEEALAQLAAAALDGRAPRVLIGGLGMGYTLRAALDALPRDASVVVAEVFRAVVEWNRSVLGSLAHDPLRDSRVTIEVVDVFDLLGRATERFDAVLLDVDNGPGCLTMSSNRRLYTSHGIARVRRALMPDGLVAVWCPSRVSALAERLDDEGFTVTIRELPARDGGGVPLHSIILGHLCSRAASDQLSDPVGSPSHEAPARPPPRVRRRSAASGPGPPPRWG